MDIVINAEIATVPAGAVPIANQGHFYHNVLACFSYPEECPPVAELLRHVYGLQGQWLVMSPIHWQATHNDAMIMAHGLELELSVAESQQWFEACAEFVRSDNLSLYFHDAHTWLLRYDGKPSVTAKPVHTLSHQSLMPQLQTLDDTLFWQKFITEIQMFFSSHPLNNARLDRCPINGLWLWGAGELHAPVQKTLVCFDESLLGMSKLLSKNVNYCPTSSSYEKSSVLLFNELNESERAVLQKKLQKNTIRWFWNNHAYVTKPKHWLSRMLGREKEC